MATTTPSVPDASSSVSATAALSDLRSELTEQLCTLAIQLARFNEGETLDTSGVCVACGNVRTGYIIDHADDCTIEQVLQVVRRLRPLLLEQRLAEAVASPSERHIVYWDPLPNQAAKVPAPVGFSHAEAAVLQALGIPAEQRSAIYAEAMARQAADDLEVIR